MGAWRSRRYHPRRRRAAWFSIIRANGAHRELGAAKDLPDWYDLLEFVAEILEVVRADAHAEHFLDHGKEIGQRTNRRQIAAHDYPRQ